MKLEMLAPAIDLDTLFPPEAAFMARTGSRETRLLGYTPLQSDTLASHTMGLFPGRASVRPHGGITPAICELFDQAGIHVAETMHAFDTLEEAESHAKSLVAEGHRLASIYPLRASVFPDDAMVVPTHLFEQLNAKRSLPELVPEAYQPKRSIEPLARLRSQAIDRTVFLKYADAAASGWGYAVRAVQNAQELEDALDAFERMSGSSESAIIVEQFEAIEVCWCAGIGVFADHTECFGGAEQRFAQAARQSGSVIDPARPFTDEASRICCAIGERARARGYRGFAGIDIGRTQQGTLVVFDLNFRLNASTAQLIYHPAASQRAGLPASTSFHTRVGGPFRTLHARLSQAIKGGDFVPTRLIDATLMPKADGQHFVDGFVLGQDRADADARAERLKANLVSLS